MSLQLKNSRMEIEFHMHSKTASVKLASGLRLTTQLQQSSERECIRPLDLKRNAFNPQFTITYAQKGLNGYKGYAHVEYDATRNTMKLVDTVVSCGKITDETLTLKLED